MKPTNGSSGRRLTAVPTRLAGACLVACLSVGIACAGTLDDVRERGRLICGVSLGLPGFSLQADDGSWSGLDVDTCRAVAAAALGDADSIAYIGLTSKERFTALQSEDVDILARNSTWTLARDAALRLNFAGVTYYDGQGFMVRKDLGLTAATELDGAVVCLNLGTTTELNLASFFRFNKMDLRTVVFEVQAAAATEYERGKCDAFTSDRSALAAFRSQFEDPDAHIILPEIISKEPLGPVVRHGDDQWFDIVKWTLFALVQAEESGVTSENVDGMKASTDPAIRHLLGVTGDAGGKLGLADDWAYQIVKQVGNYGEVYERNVGPATPIGLERGLNALWVDGGLMYAPPFVDPPADPPLPRPLPAQPRDRP